MKKLIFKDYLKDPLSTIAVNTTIFLFGIICFVLFVFTMVIIEESQEITLLDNNTYNNTLMSKLSMTK